MRWTVFILILLSGFQLKASEALLDQAEDWYRSDSFDQAVVCYDSLVSEGYVSADLYYNLGNSYYKLGKLGKAILFYEKALRLNPGDEDIRYNLDLANQQITQVEAVPEFFLVRIWNTMRDWFSARSWMWVAILFIWLSFLLGLVFLYSSSIGFRQLAFWLGIVFFLSGGMSFGLAASRYAAEVDDSMAIMTQTNFFVKSAPGEGSNDLFQIREGVKVQIIDEVDGWYRIRLADGKDGWLPVGQVDRI
jgi:tetratricopeptide (TPR) repeat protein